MIESTYKIKLKYKKNEIEITGDKDFVQQAFKDVTSLLKTENIDPLLLEKLNEVGGLDELRNFLSIDEKNNKLKTILNNSIKEIFEKVQFTTNDEIILLFAYYIKKKLNKRYFKRKDIDTFFNEIDVDKPINIPYYLRKMSTDDKHYLDPGNKQGRFFISNDGIEYIENILLSL